MLAKAVAESGPFVAIAVAPVTASKTARRDRKLLAQSVTINRPADELYAF